MLTDYFTKEESQKREQWRMKGLSYIGNCPNCSRERLCRCNNGKTRCEKCNWVVEDNDYCEAEL